MTESIIINGKELSSETSVTFGSLIGATSVVNASSSRIAFKRAGTVKGVIINVYKNADSTSRNFNVRINASDINTISITGSTTGIFENIEDDSVSIDDFLDYRLDQTTSFDDIKLRTAIRFDATTNNLMIFGMMARTTIINAVTYALINFSTASLTESTKQVVVPVDGIIKDLFVNVQSNGKDGATIFTIRKDAVDTNHTINVAASTSGLFHDTEDVTWSVGDIISMEIDASASTNVDSVEMGMIASFETTDDEQFFINSSTGFIGFSSLKFSPINTRIVTTQLFATETDAYMELNGAIDTSKLNMDVISNSFSISAQERDPISDISTGNWTTTPLWSKLDDGDSTVINSETSPSNDTFEIKLASFTDPVVHTGHIIHSRLGKSSSRVIDFTVSLYQGTTLIEAFTHNNVDTGPADFPDTISEANAANITDYADLRIRIVANWPGGGGSPSTTAEVVEAWMETPNPVSLSNILRLRKNQADANQSLNIGSSTGVFEDTANTDALEDGDKINYEFDHNADDGQLEMRYLTMIQALTSGVAIVKVSPEILDLVDDGIKVIGPVKVNDEILDLPEDALQTRTLVRLDGEILDLAEAPNLARALIRIKPEILDIPEDTALARALIRLKDEILDIPENANPLRLFSKIADELLDLPEDQLAILGIVKINPEILDLPESPNKLTALRRIENEILDIPEDTAKTQALIRIDDEILELPEAANPLRFFVKVNDEILDLAEDALFTMALVRLKAEILDLVESPLALVTEAIIIKITNEILDLVEDPLAHRARVLIADEILDLPEASNPVIGFIEIANEILDLPEDAISVLGIVKLKAEILDLVEDTATKKVMMQFGNEILDIPEVANFLKSFNRIADEILDLVEDSIITKTLTRLGNEIFMLLGPNIVDTELDGSLTSANDVDWYAGQRIDVNNAAIKSLTVRLRKFGSPTGIVRARILSSAIGTSEVVEATSISADDIDISTIGTSKSEFKFRFDDTPSLTGSIVVAVWFDYTSVGEFAEVSVQSNENHVGWFVIRDIGGVDSWSTIPSVFDLDCVIELADREAVNLRSFSRIVDEILDLPEDQLSVLGIVKLKDEILDLSEDALRVLGLVKLKAEILDIPEDSLQTRGLARIADEQLEIPEGSVITRTLVRLKNEFLDLVEGSVRVLGIVKITNEILDIVENIVKKITGPAIVLGRVRRIGVSVRSFRIATSRENTKSSVSRDTNREDESID